MLMTSWLRSVKSTLSSDSRRRARAASRRKKLPEALPSQVEMLEDRTLLSVNISYRADLTDPAVTERLVITTNNMDVGSNVSDDSIQITQSATGVVQIITNENPFDPLSTTYTITVDPNLTQDIGDNSLIFLGPDTVAARANEVEEIEVTGNIGLNTIDLSGVNTAPNNFSAITSVSADGGEQADSIVGSPFDDSIQGGDGEDTIEGGGGDDTLQGEAGADVINGDAGDDEINGGSGNDVVDGGADDDNIRGNSGRDALAGGAGADTIQGNSGRDTLSGGDGDDSLSGGNGEDQMFGGAGSDTLLGGENADLLNGGAGDDTLDGGAGNDALMGGDGADSLVGGTGDDRLQSLAPGEADENVLVDVVSWDAANAEPLAGSAGDVNLVTDASTTDSEFNPAIAIDPTSPDTVVMVSEDTTGTLVVRRSTDGGATWVDPTDRTAIGVGSDPSAAFDAFGNLYVVFRDAGGNIDLAYSADAGDNFVDSAGAVGAVFINDLDPSVDPTDGAMNPVVATGPGALGANSSAWILWEDSSQVEFAALSATALGSANVSSTADQQGVIGGTGSGRFPDVAVGPQGSVIAVYQEEGADVEGPTMINVVVNPAGLADTSGNGWAAPQPVRHPADATAPTTNVGTNDAIPAAPGGINAAPSIAWDRSGQTATNGRIYLAYTVEADDPTAATDTTENETTNATTGKFRDTDVVLVTTADLEDLVPDPNDGAFDKDPTVSWPAPKVVHDDFGDDKDGDGNAKDADVFGETRSQFMPNVEVDQTTGVVAVSWYDARNDVGNNGQPGNSNDIQALEGPDEDSGNDDAQLYGTVSIDAGSTFAPNFRVGDFEHQGTLTDASDDNQHPSNANDVTNMADVNYGDYVGLAFEGGRLNAVWADNSTAGASETPLATQFDLLTTQFRIQHDGDTMDGQAGKDTLIGNNGNDRLLAGSADASTDDNVLIGGAGEDKLTGAAGEDLLMGGANGDPVDGRNTYPRRGTALGDRLQGGAETSPDGDVLLGDDVGDTFFDKTVGEIIAGVGPGTVDPATLTINDPSDIDLVQFGADSLYGGAGDDVLYGGAGNDLLDGDGTADGADTIYGGRGDDTLIGGADADLMFGSHPADTFSTTDDDSLVGDAGDDTMHGGQGNDTLKGGAGADSVFGDIDPAHTDFDSTRHVGNDVIQWAGTPDGVDSIDGGASFDTLEVSMAAGGVDVLTVGVTGTGELTVTDAAGPTIATAELVEHLDMKTDNLGDTVTVGALTTEPSLRLLTVDLGTGGDTFTAAAIANADILVFAQGGDGDDTMTGGVGNDTLEGGNDDDDLFGGSGDDMLRGDDGADSLVGNADDDVLQGGKGTDTLKGDGLTHDAGESGDDRLEGGEDADTLLGGPGEDTLRGDDGADRMAGQGGNDTLRGGNGNDDMDEDFTDGGGAVSDTGTDSMDGGAGKDSIIGRGGNDTILGGTGDDSLGGAAGVEADDDFIRGGDGRDTINGGTGADTLQGGNHRDSILGDGAADSISGGRGKDTLKGEAGDDTIFGARGSDLIDGGADKDVISGQGGRDTIDGGDGNDIINGMGGADSINGGAGEDSISGRQGDDTLFGGAGNDLLVGGDGDDSLAGAAAAAGVGQADTLLGNDGIDDLNDEEDGTADGDTADPYSSGDGTDDVTGMDAGGVEVDTPTLDNTINASTAGFEWIDNIMSFLDLI